MVSKIIKIACLCLYLALLFYIVFFARRRQGLVWNTDLINWIPVKNTIDTWHLLKHHQNFHWFLFSNIIGNILLFIPLPYFISEFTAVRKVGLLIGLCILASFVIELTQFVLQIGVPDIDDLLLNTVGGIIGTWLYKQFYTKLIRETS